MQPLLVAYASTEGQTRKIAEFIAERLRIRGHRVDLIDTASAAAELVNPVYQAAFLGGPLHQQRHPAALAHFIDRNHAWLSALPCAFFSVSLSAALDDELSRNEVKRLLSEFVAQHQLRPLSTRCVAGALKYTQYDYFKRLLMRMISKQYGRPTDTSQDYEYTDWNDVEAFVDDFLARLHPPA